MRRLASLLLALTIITPAAVSNELTAEDAERGPILRPSPEPWPVPPPRPWPPEPPAGHELARLVRRLTIGAPVSWGQLTLYPLQAAARGESNAISMEEGLRRGCFRIHDSEEVAWVTATNGCGSPVFLMAGSTIAGGRQDRVVREDGLVPPWSGWSTVPVYCVERGRWDDGPSPFRPSPLGASPEMRRDLHRGTSQDEVWSKVEEESRSAGASSPTGRYGALMEEPGMRRRIDEAQESLCPPIRRRRNVVGVIFVRRGEILGADIFGSSRLLDEELPKLVAGHALRGWGECHRCAPPTGRIEEFLRSFEASAFTGDVGTFGIGRRYGVRASRGSGTVLVNDGVVVHAALFQEWGGGWPVPLE